jgi:excisionase family DNA binding protein
MPAVKSRPAVKPKPEPARLVSYEEAGIYARVSGRTVARWVGIGRITAHRNGASHRVRVDLDEIDEVIRGAR